MCQVVSLRVDGADITLSEEPRVLLSDALRNGCARHCVHVGCEQGVCGSCTVLVDGDPIRSCLALAVEMAAREVMTFEGLADDALMERVIAAIHTEGGLQCGYCTPRLAVAIYAEISRGTLPQDADRARHLLDAHLCRCTGYQGLVAAILSLAACTDADHNDAGEGLYELSSE